MSQRTEAGGIPVSALLNDDGTIDHSAVRARVNASHADATTISAERCDAIRVRLREGASTSEVADDVECGQSSVRRHANGGCHHHPSELAEPPVRYANHADGWVVDE